MLDGTAAAELVDHLGELTTAGTTAITCEHREEYLRHIPGLRTIRLEGRRGPEVRSLPRLPRGESPGSALKIEGLTVRLGGRRILHDLHLSVDGGQVVAVVGRNGVGKTTLLRTLTGLQQHEGTITVDGHAPDLGMVFQNADIQLFNASVRDEILYKVVEPDRELYDWLLLALGLLAYEDIPPLLLSEGEKKRVALATVLMRRPRHGLLLDEPSLGQDAAHKALWMTRRIG